jgi:hypothetical protein
LTHGEEKCREDKAESVDFERVDVTEENQIVAEYRTVEDSRWAMYQTKQ